MGMGAAIPGRGRGTPGYSLRICLMRAIASSTACSGLMPPAATGSHAAVSAAREYRL
jgi:hypothetical protein